MRQRFDLSAAGQIFAADTRRRPRRRDTRLRGHWPTPPTPPPPTTTRRRPSATLGNGCGGQVRGGRRINGLRVPCVRAMRGARESATAATVVRLWPREGDEEKMSRRTEKAGRLIRCRQPSFRFYNKIAPFFKLPIIETRRLIKRNCISIQ